MALKRRGLPPKSMRSVLTMSTIRISFAVGFSHTDTFDGGI
jgi:hypothetical protein